MIKVVQICLEYAPSAGGSISTVKDFDEVFKTKIIAFTSRINMSSDIKEPENLSRVPVLAGLFGTTLLGGSGDVNLVNQIIAAGVVIIYGTGFGLLLGKGIGYFTDGIRVSAEEEQLGLDLAEHNLSAYPEDD